VAITLAEPREHRLLRNIERQTSQKIDVAQVPTVADLRAHRQELVKATLREAVLEGGLDSYRGIVEALAGELDLMDLAAAAVKLVAARDGGEEAEIPAVTPREPRERFEGRGDRPFGRERDTSSRGDARERRPEGGAKGKKAKRDTPWTAATLWIGAGRKLKMRPGDLVGAIANEAGLDSAHIGSIQIADNFSTVEVPEAMADEVISALKNTKIKGLRVQVRRDRMRCGARKWGGQQVVTPRRASEVGGQQLLFESLQRASLGALGQQQAADGGKRAQAACRRHHDRCEHGDRDAPSRIADEEGQGACGDTGCRAPEADPAWRQVEQVTSLRAFGCARNA
jgi:hypothetical protein